MYALGSFSVVLLCFEEEGLEGGFAFFVRWIRKGSGQEGMFIFR
jgi:hypothetical protein